MVIKNKIRKLHILLLSLFFTTLIFFTLFGKEVYNKINTYVETFTVGVYYIFDDEHYFQIPKTAVHDEEYIYVINTEQGFSMKIFTIEKRLVKCYNAINEYPDSDKYVFVLEGLKSGEMIVKNAELQLSDGQRVVN